MDDTNRSEAGPFQLLILLLSVFVLCALAAETFFALPPELAALLRRLDTIICLVFLADFFLRLRRAADRKAFMRWGWLDLVSSVPAVPALRIGRIFRVVRLLRVLRAFRSAKVLLQHLYRDRGRAALSTAAGAAFLTAISASIAVLNFENVPGANISTAADGLWWSFYTLANIDYGGHFPVTPEGKLLRLLLVTAGMVLFGVFTGYAASYFLSGEEERETGEIAALRAEVSSLRSELKK